MSPSLTPDQLQQLESLGISISKSTISSTQDVKVAPPSPPSIAQISLSPNLGNHPDRLPTKQKIPLLPLFSLSGLSLISFGGLVLLKAKDTSSTSPPPASRPLSPNLPGLTGTQVPKSIQHYLLASQQSFTQALTSQSQQDTTSTLASLNNALTTASEAIVSYPDDYRGWEQRGRIYLSLSDSQPELIPLAINDFSQALRLNSHSAELTRTLASLYAKKGDAQNTLAFLVQTVALEPTKAQNFYDLARLQQSTGLVPQALDTYTRLLTLTTDSLQRQQVTREIDSLKALVAQNSLPQNSTSTTTSISPTPQLTGPQIQALTDSPGLIIAAPETKKDIAVSNLSSHNSLSGTTTLPAHTPSLTLQNSQLTSSSQVYLTITQGGKNLSLQVLSRTHDSFTVGLVPPATEDIEFKWWIVN